MKTDTNEYLNQIAYLYIIVNRIDGQRYIGCTWGSGTPEKRFQAHMSGNGGVFVAEAVQRDGKESFSMHVVRSGPLWYIRELEIRAIRLLSHKKTGKGYNACISKGIVISAAGKRRLEENRSSISLKISQTLQGHEVTITTRKKISQANIGKTASLETKQKISEATTGIKNGFFGKTHSEALKEKLADLRRSEATPPQPKVYVCEAKARKGKDNPMYGKSGRITGSKNPNYKPITVLGTTYETMAEAVAATGLSRYQLREYFRSNNFPREREVYEQIAKGSHV